MTAKEFIVAIELGSSKIAGIAGKTNDGNIQILAYASEDASDCIRKGLIYNINKTAMGLTSVVSQLEEQLKAKIAKVYVGIGGQSLYSMKNFVVEQLGVETIISEEIVQRLSDINRQTRYPDLDILEVVPQEYKVKNKIHTDPVGVLGSQIEGHFLNIVARTSVKRNIETCFGQAGIEIAGFFIAPEVLADIVLTDVEKRSGCALVDIGYDTTTVAVYKDRILRHLAVIPLGSNNITKDICSLQIEDGEAEALKCKYGSAFTMPGVNTDDDEYPVNDVRKIKANLLNEIVAARVEEIVLNVQNQIKLSGYENKLPAGIVVTGGGSNLRNLQDAFKQQKNNEYVKVRIAGFVLPQVYYTDSKLLEKNGRQNTVFALLAAGKENCASREATPATTDMFAQQEEVEARNLAQQQAAAAAKALEDEKKAKEAKEQQERANKINNNAKKEVESAAETVAQSLERINEAKRKVEKAETDKDKNAAKQANLMADNALKEAQVAKSKAEDAMKRFTGEDGTSFLTEARTVYADIETKYKEVEETTTEIRALSDKVKRQNSFLGKLRNLGDVIMED